ncbi:MAG: hypothetical protein FDX30_10185 [Chlorobium sp.]|nr:MAG: hypothetical protein FDX30_10185 [Chlorobium sp.]
MYAGASLTTPSPYLDNETDGAYAVGLGIGNPHENLGLQATVLVLNIDQFNRFAMNVHAFRCFGDASAIGVGVENIRLDNATNDSDKSYYVVYSHCVDGDSLVNPATGRSKLHFSIGAGSGRFGDKSEFDIASGKGEHGTYVFGNVAYELFNEFNIISDWNGLNLNAGISKTFLLGNNVPFVVTLGAADLTRNSGDGVRFIASIGTGFTL